MFVEHTILTNDIEKCNVARVTHNYHDQLTNMHLLLVMGKSDVYIYYSFQLLVDDSISST